MSSRLLLAGSSLSVLIASALLIGPTASHAGDTDTVDCTFPGQVRRLGAYSTTVTPRRKARVTEAECRNGGGEYVETVAASTASTIKSSPSSIDQPDISAALKIWLPVAQAGVPAAQVNVGELLERTGDLAQAKTWYEKAAAQGSLRAKVNLASMYERGAGTPRDAVQAQLLILQAAGLPASGDGGMRIQLVDPAASIRLPTTLAGKRNITLDVPPGSVAVTGSAESPAGIASVAVNGTRVNHDANGLFTVPLSLGDDPTALTITVTDQSGGTGSAEFVLQRSTVRAVEATAPAAPLQPLSGKRLALVIANQNYRHWEKLDTPLADARSLGDALHARFGFEVSLLTDGTRKAMLQALNQLRATAGPDDQVIVFYAGHGQMDPVTARGYWIPVDADTREVSDWVSVIDVTDQLSALQARHVLVIADSCYSGTLAGSLATRIDAALSAEQRQRHLTQVSTRRARVAFTSGGLEPVIDGGGGNHSLFARSLLEVLATVEGPVGAHELSGVVSARFSMLGKPLKVSQKPLYAPIAFAGHEAGDFVLAPLR